MNPLQSMLVAQTALILLAKAPDDLPASAYSDLLDNVGSFVNDEQQNVMTYNFSDNCLQHALRTKDDVCENCGQTDCHQNRAWVTYCLYQFVRGHVPSRYDYEQYICQREPLPEIALAPTDETLLVLNICGALEPYTLSPAAINALQSLPFVVKVAQFKDQTYVEVSEPMSLKQYDQFMEAVRS